MWRILKAEIITDKLRIMLIYFCAIICFVITWFGVSLDRNRAPLAMLIMVAATLLIVNACYLLTRDVRIVFDKKYHRMFTSIFWVLIYLAAILPFYIMTNMLGALGENTPLQLSLDEMSRSPIGINAVGLILSGSSYYAFLKRKSYLE